MAGKNKTTQSLEFVVDARADKALQTFSLLHKEADSIVKKLLVLQEQSKRFGKNDNFTIALQEKADLIGNIALEMDKKIKSLNKALYTIESAGNTTIKLSSDREKLTDNKEISEIEKKIKNAENAIKKSKLSIEKMLEEALYGGVDGGFKYPSIDERIKQIVDVKNVVSNLEREINLKVSKTFKTLDNQIKNLDMSFQSLSRSASVSFKKAKFDENNLNTYNAYQQVLNKQRQAVIALADSYKEYKKQIKLVEGDFSESADKTRYKYSKLISNVEKAISGLTLKYKEVSSLGKNLFDPTKTDISKTIVAYEREINKIENILNKTQGKISDSQKLKGVEQITLLENKVRELKQLLDKPITNVDLLNFKETQNRLEQFKLNVTKTIQDINLEVRRFKEIKPPKLPRIDTNITNKVDLIRTKYQELQKTLIATYNTQAKYIDSVSEDKYNRMVQSIQRYERNLNILNTTYNKYVSKLKEAEESGNLGNQLKYRELILKTASAIEKLNNKQKILQTQSKNVFKSTNAELQDTLHNYEKLKFNLERVLETKRKWTKSENIKEAQDQIKTLDDEIKKLKNTMQGVAEGKLVSNKSIRDAKNKMKAYQAEIAKTKDKLSELSGVKWFKNIAGRALAYTSVFSLIYGLTNMIKESVAYIAEEDKAMKTLQAVIGSTEAEARKLEHSFVKLGQTFGGTLESINKVAYELGRAGIATDDLVDSTKVVIQMALLTGDTYEVSSNALVGYITNYKDLIETQYKGKNAVEVLGNKLAKVANDSRMTTQDIATAGNYMLAMARATGLTVDALGALQIAFSNAGNNASTIGTMTSRLLTVLQGGSEETKRMFEELGVNTKNLLLNLQQGGEASNKAFITFLKTLKSTSKIKFTKLLSSLQILDRRGLQTLYNTADVVIDKIGEMSETTSGELGKASIIANSYTNIWERLKNTLGEVATKLEPVVGALASAGKGLMSVFGSETEAQLMTKSDMLQALQKKLDLYKELAKATGGYSNEIKNLKNEIKGLSGEIVNLNSLKENQAGYKELGQSWKKISKDRSIEDLGFTGNIYNAKNEQDILRAFKGMGSSSIKIQNYLDLMITTNKKLFDNLLPDLMKSNNKNIQYALVSSKNLTKEVAKQVRISLGDNKKEIDNIVSVLASDESNTKDIVNAFSKIKGISPQIIKSLETYAGFRNNFIKAFSDYINIDLNSIKQEKENADNIITASKDTYQAYRKLLDIKIKAGDNKELKAFIEKAINFRNKDLELVKKTFTNQIKDVGKENKDIAQSMIDNLEKSGTFSDLMEKLLGYLIQYKDNVKMTDVVEAIQHLIKNKLSLEQAINKAKDKISKDSAKKVSYYEKEKARLEELNKQYNEFITNLSLVANYKGLVANKTLTSSQEEDLSKLAKKNALLKASIKLYKDNKELLKETKGKINSLLGQKELTQIQKLDNAIKNIKDKLKNLTDSKLKIELETQINTLVSLRDTYQTTQEQKVNEDIKNLYNKHLSDKNKTDVDKIREEIFNLNSNLGMISTLNNNLDNVAKAINAFDLTKSVNKWLKSENTDKKLSGYVGNSNKQDLEITQINKKLIKLEEEKKKTNDPKAQKEIDNTINELKKFKLVLQEIRKFNMSVIGAKAGIEALGNSINSTITNMLNHQYDSFDNMLEDFLSSLSKGIVNGVINSLTQSMTTALMNSISNSITKSATKSAIDSTTGNAMSMVNNPNAKNNPYMQKAGMALMAYAGGNIAGSVGDTLTGSQTKAGTYAGIGAAIGSVGGLPGMVAGGAIGAIIGGSMGKTITKATGIIFKSSTFKASLKNTLEYTTKNKKSWFSNKTWDEVKDASYATVKQVNDLFKTYNYLIDTLGNGLDVSLAGGIKYNKDKLTETFSKSLFNSIGVNAGTYSKIWSDYAKALGEDINQSISEAFKSYIDSIRNMNIFVAQINNDKVKASILNLQNLNNDLEYLKELLDVPNVTIDNYSKLYEAQMKTNPTPDVIENWNALGSALQKATEAEKEYYDTLRQQTYDDILFAQTWSEYVNQKLIDYSNSIIDVFTTIIDSLSSLKSTWLGDTETSYEDSVKNYLDSKKTLLGMYNEDGNLKDTYKAEDVQKVYNDFINASNALKGSSDNLINFDLQKLTQQTALTDIDKITSLTSNLDTIMRVNVVGNDVGLAVGTDLSPVAQSLTALAEYQYITPDDLENANDTLKNVYLSQTSAVTDAINVLKDSEAINTADLTLATEQSKNDVKGAIDILKDTNNASMVDIENATKLISGDGKYNLDTIDSSISSLESSGELNTTDINTAISNLENTEVGLTDTSIDKNSTFLQQVENAIETMKLANISGLSDTKSAIEVLENSEKDNTTDLTLATTQSKTDIANAIKILEDTNNASLEDIEIATNLISGSGKYDLNTIKSSISSLEDSGELNTTDINNAVSNLKDANSTDLEALNQAVVTLNNDQTNLLDSKGISVADALTYLTQNNKINLDDVKTASSTLTSVKGLTDNLPIKINDDGVGLSLDTTLGDVKQYTKDTAEALGASQNINWGDVTFDKSMYSKDDLKYIIDTLGVTNQEDLTSILQNLSNVKYSGLNYLDTLSSGDANTLIQQIQDLGLNVKDIGSLTSVSATNLSNKGVDVSNLNIMPSTAKDVEGSIYSGITDTKSFKDRGLLDLGSSSDVGDIFGALSNSIDYNLYHNIKPYMDKTEYSKLGNYVIEKGYDVDKAIINQSKELLPFLDKSFFVHNDGFKTMANLLALDKLDNSGSYQKWIDSIKMLSPNIPIWYKGSDGEDYLITPSRILEDYPTAKSWADQQTKANTGYTDTDQYLKDAYYNSQYSSMYDDYFNIYKEQGYAVGGYTKKGIGQIDETGERIAGVVHEDEWVAPKWMLQQMPDIFQQLESIRKTKAINNIKYKFADGGYTLPVTTQDVQKPYSVNVETQTISLKETNNILIEQLRLQKKMYKILDRIDREGVYERVS